MLEYYRELAALRGELCGALMSGNHAMASQLLHKIEKLGPAPGEGEDFKRRLTLSENMAIAEIFEETEKKIRSLFAK